MKWYHYVLIVTAISIILGFVLIQNQSHYTVTQKTKDGRVFQTWKSIGYPWKHTYNRDDWYIINAETGERQWISGPIDVELWTVP